MIQNVGDSSFLVLLWCRIAEVYSKEVRKSSLSFLLILKEKN
jgi:hypothetical protein